MKLVDLEWLKLLGGKKSIFAYAVEFGTVSAVNVFELLLFSFFVSFEFDKLITFLFSHIGTTAQDAASERKSIVEKHVIFLMRIFYIDWARRINDG